ncbi:MgtC/SapB family protein [Candidatus Microgenomates bacterium]|nr:MgtC/SapB family protein [Candidatus Microgenomates bacterium]
MEGQIIYRIGLAVVLGAFIGLERQIHQTNEIGNKKGSEIGLRTFSLIALLGAIAGLLSPQLPVLAGSLGAFMGLLIFFYYFFDSWFTRDYGFTTEMAMGYVFLMGYLLGVAVLSPLLLVGITILVAVILSRKDMIHKATESIHRKELQSFTSYLVIALIILPLLPDRSFAITDIPFVGEIAKEIGTNRALSAPFLNPHTLWLYVALISGVDVAGYILERVVGQKKGWFLTSLVGGLISSTATTYSLAKESVGSKIPRLLVSAAILANLASFVQIAALMAPLNKELFARTLPVLGMIMLGGGAVCAWFLLRRTTADVPVKSNAVRKATKSSSHRLFSIYPALKFVGLYLGISIISKLAYSLFGTTGFIVSMGIAALTGMDAVTVALAQFAGGQIDYRLALAAFVFANFVNLTTKAVFSFTAGSREFGVRFLMGSVAMSAAGVLGILLF